MSPKFVCLWLVVCAGFAGLCVADWDYLMLELQWAGGYCAASACTNVPKGINYFTLHGLWPSDTSGDNPANCDNNWDFNVNNVSSIINDMNMYWPSFATSSSNADFWEHEWTKHGTCASSDTRLYGELNFCTAALTLRSQISMYKILSKNSITPSSSYYYTSTQFLDAIQSALSVTAALSCQSGQDTYKGKMVLSAIGICFDNTLQMMDCPPSELNMSNCQKQNEIYFAPVTSN